MNYIPGSHHCSFCGRSDLEVEHLIAGPNNVYICNRCVERLQIKLLEAQGASPYAFPTEQFHVERLISPREMMAHLDEYVVCLLYTSPSPRDRTRSRMPSSA